MKTGRVWINVYKGKKGIEKALLDIIKVGEPFVGWGATDQAEKIAPGFTQHYLAMRAKKKITARQLYVEGKGHLDSKYSEFKTIPQGYSGPADDVDLRQPRGCLFMVYNAALCDCHQK